MQPCRLPLPPALPASHRSAPAALPFPQPPVSAASRPRTPVPAPHSALPSALPPDPRRSGTQPRQSQQGLRKPLPGAGHARPPTAGAPQAGPVLSPCLPHSCWLTRQPGAPAPGPWRAARSRPSPAPSTLGSSLPAATASRSGQLPASPCSSPASRWLPSRWPAHPPVSGCLPRPRQAAPTTPAARPAAPPFPRPPRHPSSPTWTSLATHSRWATKDAWWHAPPLHR